MKKWIEKVKNNNKILIRKAIRNNKIKIKAINNNKIIINQIKNKRKKMLISHIKIKNKIKEKEKKLSINRKSNNQTKIMLKILMFSQIKSMKMIKIKIIICN